MAVRALLRPAPCLQRYAASSPACSRLATFLKLPTPAGRTIHYMVFVLLSTGPLALAVAGVLFAFSWGKTTEREMLIVYGVSAIRVLGILPYFFPHLRVLGDVMGDVLFHLQPEDSPFFAKKETIPRLRGLLQALRSGDEKLVLIGYSQGSVICWEVLRENPDLADKFITIGSPLNGVAAGLIFIATETT